MGKRLKNVTKSTYRRTLQLEQLEQRNMLAVWSVTNHADDGTGDPGTLSRAINNVNGALNPNESHLIRFQLGEIFDPDDNRFISISGELPAITAKSVEIDGFDATLSTADKRVVLLGGNTSFVSALRYQGDAVSSEGHFNVHHWTFAISYFKVSCFDSLASKC